MTLYPDDVGTGGTQEGVGTKRPGGRAARVRRDVLEAVTHLLAEGGFGALNVEAIAARAGVHRTTIYRRWATLDDLVLDTLRSGARQAIRVPDTGDLRSDLRQLLGEIAAALATPLGHAVVHATLAASPYGSRRSTTRAKALAEVREAFWATRFDLAGEVLRRAVARGDLDPGINLRHLLEVLVAPLYYRTFVLGAPVDAGVVERTIELVLPSR
ncbi:MAG: TetR family transcriptional regulator [Acidimicrobiia bacterium]|nr:TetR family transcriptional regulator [Acidimicrobiia bacterium]